MPTHAHVGVDMGLWIWACGYGPVDTGVWIRRLPLWHDHKVKHSFTIYINFVGVGIFSPAFKFFYMLEVITIVENIFPEFFWSIWDVIVVTIFMPNKNAFHCISPWLLKQDARCEIRPTWALSIPDEVWEVRIVWEWWAKEFIIKNFGATICSSCKTSILWPISLHNYP